MGVCGLMFFHTRIVVRWWGVLGVESTDDLCYKVSISAVP